MELAYYRERADERFWSTQWERSSLEQLLRVAESSATTRFLERHVRPGLRVIEGGCGLGQYVVYFGRRGVRILGVDYSASALAAHRDAYPVSELLRADLARLPLESGGFDVYVSLGVIEHYEDSGREILAEAHRVLADDGRLVLSTPYLNHSRRLLRGRIEARQRLIAGAGGSFYQYAFDERTLDGILAGSGFEVVERSYYDPGRGVRDLLRLWGRPAAPGGAPSGSVTRASRSLSGRAARWLLYSRASLRAFAHMQIVCAAKARGGVAT